MTRRLTGRQIATSRYSASNDTISASAVSNHKMETNVLLTGAGTGYVVAVAVAVASFGVVDAAGIVATTVVVVIMVVPIVTAF